MDGLQSAARSPIGNMAGAITKSFLEGKSRYFFCEFLKVLENAGTIEYYREWFVNSVLSLQVLVLQAIWRCLSKPGQELGQIGHRCFDTTKTIGVELPSSQVVFDCDAGYSNWQRTWSADKKAKLGLVFVGLACALSQRFSWCPCDCWPIAAACQQFGPKFEVYRDMDSRITQCEGKLVLNKLLKKNEQFKNTL